MFKKGEKQFRTWDLIFETQGIGEKSYGSTTNQTLLFAHINKKIRFKRSEVTKCYNLNHQTEVNTKTQRKNKKTVVKSMLIHRKGV